MTALRLPTISIVTPTRNHGCLLEDTIQSVTGQHYGALEYIVMDGGSTDATPEILAGHSGELAKWESAPDDGPYHAINSGLASATGEVFGWLNSGDSYLDHTLATVGELFAANPDVQWVSTLHPLSCTDGSPGTRQYHLPGFSRTAFLDGLYCPAACSCSSAYIQQESTFWRRQLWEAVGGLNTSIPLAADFDLWCRFYEHAEMVGVDCPLAVFRHHAGQRSGSAAYGAQAAESLVRCRHGGASTASAAMLARRLRLHRVPFLCGVVAHLVGYRGTYLSRRRGGVWTLNSHRFF